MTFLRRPYRSVAILSGRGLTGFEVETPGFLVSPINSDPPLLTILSFCKHYVPDLRNRNTSVIAESFTLTRNPFSSMTI